MKLVREYINEKFTEDSDPVKDMGIGVTGSQIFSDVDEFTNYLVDAVIPYIYGGKIPEDILKNVENGRIISIELYEKLVDFLEKHKYKMKDNSEVYVYPSMPSSFTRWLYKLKNKLKARGYKS